MIGREVGRWMAGADGGADAGADDGVVDESMDLACIGGAGLDEDVAEDILSLDKLLEKSGFTSASLWTVSGGT